MRSIFGRELGAHRRAILGWVIGLVALVAFTLVFYPSIRDNPEFDAIMERMPDSLRAIVGEKSITSPEGYLEAQLFLYLIPLLFGIWTIGRGADAVAGEEKRKTMDLLLANPIKRGRVIIEKFAATTSGLLIMAAAVLISLAIGAGLVSMDIGVGELAATVLGSLLVALLFGALGLMVASATGAKGLAIGVAASLMTASYFVYSLSSQAEILETISKVSPFYLYLKDSPLENGIPPVHFAILLVVTVVFVALAVFTFDRRDIKS
jgi:ABC-2 type transport system permease protein